MLRQSAKLATIALLLSPAATLAVESGTPAASAPISVKVNMARILRINTPAATVIIGNPGVADVTIQDPLTLVLTGRSYGQTNLIVLNAAGNPIADTLVEVVQDQADLVTMFSGSVRASFSCASRCAPTVTLGDNPDYTEQQTRSLELITKSQTQN